MPADESPLEAIVELRQRDSFKYFVKAFRHFQEQTVINLLNAHGDPEIIKRASEAASSMLADWVGKFRKDVEDLRVKRVEGSFAWLLAVSSALYDWTGLSLKALAELVPHAFKIRSLTRPWWTVVTDKPWAAAGLVYESLERSRGLKPSSGRTHLRRYGRSSIPSSESSGFRFLLRSRPRPAFTRRPDLQPPALPNVDISIMISYGFIEQRRRIKTISLELLFSTWLLDDKVCCRLRVGERAG
jgi:hypothetical protein